MARPNLKTVPAPTTKPGRKIVSVVAALDGTSRDLLVALRLTLAQQIDAGLVSSNSIASSYKELRELDRLIRAADMEQAEIVERGDDEDENFDASSI